MMEILAPYFPHAGAMKYENDEKKQGNSRPY